MWKSLSYERNRRAYRMLMLATPYWLGASLTALVAVVYAKCFGFIEHIALGWIGIHNPMVFIYTPICFLAAWLAVRLFAHEAAGSGIPQLIASIELTQTRKPHLYVKKLLNIPVILVKMLSSMILLLGGGATGREGPTVHIAGSIFSVISNRMPSFWPAVNKRLMLIAGGAAGIAAAFNTPLGGIVFSLEELAKMHISYFRSAVVSAVIIAGVIAQSIMGNYLYLGYPSISAYNFGDILLVVLVAIIGGALGALLCKLILVINTYRNSIKNTVVHIFSILIIGLLFACMLYWNGKIAAGPGKELMNDYLFSANPAVHYTDLLFRFFAPILTYTSGAAAGIFAPALSAGAAVGGLVSELFHATNQLHLLALCGMIAFLTGVTRTPFTSFVLVMEMTNAHPSLVPMMMASMLAYGSSYLIDKHSFYERLKEHFIKKAHIQSLTTA